MFPSRTECIEFLIGDILHDVYKQGDIHHHFLFWHLITDIVGLSHTRTKCCLYADDIFWCIFLNVKLCILTEISSKLVPKDLIDNKAPLV